ncbi:MAG: hypothetical protein SF029_11080 [bacterium]|nr:hypothetical protein [bacterium]
MIQVGDPAPRFTLPQAQGDPVVLDDVLNSGQHALLIFLRHLG